MDYGDVDDEEYFSIYYRQGGEEVENRLEDASDIAGLHQVELPDEYSKYRYFPQETFIDIKEDGSATVLSYQTADVMYGAETDTLQDENLNAYLAETEGQEENPFYWIDVRGYYEKYLDANKIQFMYLDEQNNFKFADDSVPFRVEIATGYMVQEYGETKFKKVEQADVNIHLNENGVPAISSLFNSVSDFVITENKSRGENVEGFLVSPLEFSLETASLTKANSNAVRLPFLVNSEGLRSVSQVEGLVGLDYNARIEETLQLEAYADDPHQPYVTNNNELMHFLEITETADNPTEYTGYTQDNHEIVPEVVFINYNGGAYTSREDGTIWVYNSENGTWDREGYSTF